MTLWRTAALGWNGWLLAASVFVVGGCRSGVEMQRMPDGSTVLKCHAGLGKCIDAIDTLCKGNSYEILYARDDQKIYGSENESQIENRSSLAAVHCLGPHEKVRGPDAAAAYALPASVDPRGAASRGSMANGTESNGASATNTSAPNTTGTPTHVCVPGSTQACVGAAACNGGQACLPDGSGFAPCDCGAVPAAGN